MAQKKKAIHTSQHKPTLEQIQGVTELYADCPLECDGMTNVLHFYLNRAQIEHHVYEGHVADTKGKDSITWHIWIQIETDEGMAIVDYRTHMWLGKHEHIPQGVFLKEKYPHIEYTGREIKPLRLPEDIIFFLIEKPKPPEWQGIYQP